MDLTRRNFIAAGLSSLGTAATGLAFGGVLEQPGLEQPQPGSKSAAAAHDDKEALVVLFLRGGCDSLSLLPPLAGLDHALYQSARPALNIPISGTNAALPLDAQFGLHPAAIKLQALFREKRLAFVQATGISADNRSHFAAQSLIEGGTLDRRHLAKGWITRYLEQSAGPGKPSFLSAVSMGLLVPNSLHGTQHVALINNPKNFGLNGPEKILADQIPILRKMYAGQDDLSLVGTGTLDAISAMPHDTIYKYRPAPGVTYAGNHVGQSLRGAAALLKRNLGVKVATIDMGGWDIHRAHGTPSDGPFANQVEQLSLALDAFDHDMRGFPVTVVVLSEFGRRLKENASGGTDHGHGGMMMLLGSSVAGGRIHGRWPGLSTPQLYDQADLAVTTDYRQVLGEILERKVSRSKIGEIFPGFSFKKALGVMS